MLKLERAYTEYSVANAKPENWELAVDVNGVEVIVSTDESELVVLQCVGTDKPLTHDDVIDGELIADKEGYLFNTKLAEENGMERCDECGVWFYRGDGGICTEDGFCFCEDCIDRGMAFKCEDCGEWYSRDYYNGRGLQGEDEWGDYIYLCEECSENWFECRACGRLYPNECIHWRNDGEADYECGGYICEDCAEEEKHEEEDKPIQSYHYDGDETDYGMPYLGDDTDNATETDRKYDLTLGVELEVDCGGENPDNAEITREEMGHDYCRICHDGSLRKGFEIISCPATLRAHRKKIGWKNAMKALLKLGYKSHDPGTCGLHVHMDRQYFLNSYLTSEEIEGAMFVVLRNNLEWLKLFSRRFDYGYCVINGERNDEGIDTMGKVKSDDEYKDKWEGKAKLKRHDRYQALNFSRSDTIEFRLFRGTLNYQTFLATLEFVELFASLVKGCFKVEDAYEIDMERFIDRAESEGFYDFLNYMKELGFIDNDETGF